MSLISRSVIVKTFWRVWGYVTGRAQPEAPEFISAKTLIEERELVMQRDALRDEWHHLWANQGLDFVLTVAHPFPALAHGDGPKSSLMSASYTFLFNMVSPTSNLVRAF